MKDEYVIAMMALLGISTKFENSDDKESMCKDIATLLKWCKNNDLLDTDDSFAAYLINKSIYEYIEKEVLIEWLENCQS